MTITSRKAFLGHNRQCYSIQGSWQMLVQTGQNISMWELKLKN